MFVVSVRWQNGDTTFHVFTAEQLGASNFVGNMPNVPTAIAITIERL